MENAKSKPTIRRRKNLLMSKVQDINYDELYKLYESDCKLRNISPLTIKGYEYAHTYFKRWIGVDVELKCSDITQDLIIEYILSLKDRLKPESVNSYQFKLSPVIKFGIRRGYIKDEISFTHLVEQEHFKEIYSEDELRTLLVKPKSDSFAQYRTWVIINLLIATGIRAKELRELLIKDVNLDNGILTLNHTKNRKSRMIPIPTSLHVVLNEYLRIRAGSGEEVLFCNIYGEYLQRTTLQLSVTKYCKARGLTKYSLHLFRHTFITLSVRKGMSPILLKRITGHSSMKTLNNYYNFDIQDLVNVVDEYNPLEQFNSKSKKNWMK